MREESQLSFDRRDRALSIRSNCRSVRACPRIDDGLRLPTVFRFLFRLFKKINFAWQKFILSAICRCSSKADKLGLPKINMPARSGSSYDLLDGLVELNPFCNSDRNYDPKLVLNDELWKFSKEFMETFCSIKMGILQMKSNELIPRDFFRQWL